MILLQRDHEVSIWCEMPSSCKLPASLMRYQCIRTDVTCASRRRRSQARLFAGWRDWQRGRKLARMQVVGLWAKRKRTTVGTVFRQWHLQVGARNRAARRLCCVLQCPQGSASVSAFELCQDYCTLGVCILCCR